MFHKDIFVIFHYIRGNILKAVKCLDLTGKLLHFAITTMSHSFPVFFVCLDLFYLAHAIMLFLTAIVNNHAGGGG